MSDVFMHNSHRLPVTFARGGKRCTPLRGVDKYMLLAPAPDKLTMTSKGRPALAGRMRRGQSEVCGRLQKF
jgi:hypothetical protein